MGYGLERRIVNKYLWDGNGGGTHVILTDGEPGKRIPGFFDTGLCPEGKFRIDLSRVVLNGTTPVRNAHSTTYLANGDNAALYIDRETNVDPETGDRTIETWVHPGYKDEKNGWFRPDGRKLARTVTVAPDGTIIRKLRVDLASTNGGIHTLHRTERRDAEGNVLGRETFGRDAKCQRQPVSPDEFKNLLKAFLAPRGPAQG